MLAGVDAGSAADTLRRIDLDPRPAILLDSNTRTQTTTGAYTFVTSNTVFVRVNQLHSFSPQVTLI
jgi:hypothetical protein